jgi:hypothetical protein
MRLDTDAWDVASALKQPRSVREICRATRLGSFRACQILWTLRLLGVAAYASTEAAAEQDAAESAVASAAEAFSLASPEEPSPIAVAAPLEETVLQIAAEATRWIPDAAEESRVLPLATGDASSEVLHDLWRLAAEKAPDRPMRPEGPEEPEEPATETHEPIEEPEPEPAPMEVAAETTEMREPTAGALAFGEAEPASPPEMEEPEPELESPAAEPLEPEPESPAEMELEVASSAEPEAPEPQAAWDPGATMKLSRDEVAAAIAAPSMAEPDTAAFDPTPLEAGEPEAAPPEASPLLDADIARFNARQRLLYRSIRAEVGAGAANFVRSCRTDLFAEAELAPDGTWDAERLRRTLAHRPVETAPEAFERLLEAQIERLTQHIGPSRAEALREQIRKL